MDTKKQAYKLGQVYGLAAKYLPDVLGTPGKVTTAALTPLQAAGQAIMALHTNRAITPDIDVRLADIMQDVDPDFPALADLDLQGAWWAGYYNAGKIEAQGIAENRKAKGLSQAQLASAIGVLQKDISRWETGKVKPSDDTLAKIAAALGCEIGRLRDGNI